MRVCTCGSWTVTAIDDWRAARESRSDVPDAVGLARAEAMEKAYVLDEKRELADAFPNYLASAWRWTFYGFPQSGPVRQQTLRDGVEQYGQKFAQFVIAEETLSLTTNTNMTPACKA